MNEESYESQRVPYHFEFTRSSSAKPHQPDGFRISIEGDDLDLVQRQMETALVWAREKAVYPDTIEADLEASLEKHWSDDQDAALRSAKVDEVLEKEGLK